jgi:hypothetical protein
MNEPVLCFDRDRTVDVSPPASGTPVPLSWVQFYAHRTGHDVWATGNPRLCREAGIPSPREARQLLVAASVDPVAEYDRMNTGRIDRLRLLEQLYDVTDQADVRFVVVDDTDVTAFTDGREWSYYQPGEFVSAVESGTLPRPDPEAVPGDSYGPPERADASRAMLERFEQRLPE